MISNISPVLKQGLAYTLGLLILSGCSVRKTAEQRQQEKFLAQEDAKCKEGKFFDQYHTGHRMFKFKHPKDYLAVTEGYIQSIDKREKVRFIVNKKDSTLFMQSTSQGMEGKRIINTTIGKTKKDFEFDPVGSILWEEALASFENKGPQPR
jgi:hypothetical protein